MLKSADKLSRLNGKHAHAVEDNYGQALERENPLS